MGSLDDLRNKFVELADCVGDFSFEEGWVPLLWTLAYSIERLNAESREGFVISQIKEKYGRLSIQAVAGPEVESLIVGAEHSSETTCAVCGGLGKLEQRGWMRVLCDAHRITNRHR